jgi:hypothetical protein
MNRIYFTLVFLSLLLFASCSDSPDNPNTSSPEVNPPEPDVDNKDTLVCYFNYPFGLDTHPNKVQLCVNEYAYILVDSLENYKVVKGVIKFQDYERSFVVDEQYKQELLKSHNHLGAFYAQKYLNQELSGALIDKLDVVQYTILSRDPEIKSDSVPAIYGSFISVYLKYIKSRDIKFKRWLSAVDDYSCGNPEMEGYNCEILKNLESFSIPWEKVK